MKSYIIAIDGYSSTGKSTLAKQIATELGYTYIDTGAMYRAVTYFALENNCFNDKKLNINKLQNILPKIHLALQHGVLFLNNQQLVAELRSMEVAEKVSLIAKEKIVRAKLVAIQRTWAIGKKIVMDGRDIGTVVFPNATIKFFITAAPEIRAKRRYDELISIGKPIAYEIVLKNIKERDYIDSHRSIAPLKAASDAIIIDNSTLNREEQLTLCLSYIHQKIKSCK